jgi:hypothetical protein
VICFIYRTYVVPLISWCNFENYVFWLQFH